MDMHEKLVLAETAVHEERHDPEALALYWDAIRSDTESAALPEMYRLLYTARTAQREQNAVTELIAHACHAHFPDIPTLAMMADGEYRAGRDDNALQLYDRLLTLNGMTNALYAHLKVVCFRHQPFDDFINLLLHRCLAEHSDDDGIVRFLFSQYAGHEKFAHAPCAPPVYQRLLELEPDNVSARALLCECYCRQDKYAEAIAEGEAGLQYQKQHPDLLAALAQAHYQNGEYGKVVTYSRAVLAKRPGRRDIQILLAEVYTHNALTTNEAIRAYRLALDYAPGHLHIRQALLRSYLRKLMIDDAIAECELVVEGLYERHNPDSRDFRQAVKAMIEEYERAIRRAPGDIPLYLITARLYEYIGHLNKALIYYRTMLELPLDRNLIERLIEFLERLAISRVQNPHLYVYLGLLYHKMGQHTNAHLAFQTVMYSDLDEREVEDILISSDQTLWRYPPVLVILAHHRIVTKDIVEGLVKTFRQEDREDWNGALWALQELYDVEDVIDELPQMFAWESFPEVCPHIIPILVNNGSRSAFRVLCDLLSHPQGSVRLEALETLLHSSHPLVEQYLSDASTDIPYPDVRLGIAQNCAQADTEQSTYRLITMLHDADRDVRACVIAALQERDVVPEALRNAVFTEQDPELRTALIAMLARLQDPAEGPYLAHLLTDLVAKRHADIHHASAPGKVYQRLKKLIKHEESPEENGMFSTLIQALGFLQSDDAIPGLLAIASDDPSVTLRKHAVHALGQIGSSLGVGTLQEILHAGSEPQDLRTEAEQAMARIIDQNTADEHV